MTVFHKDEHYKICIIAGNQTLNYTCRIIRCEEGFITFIDRNKNIWNYNIAHILSYDEAKGYDF
jgi:hypothetical protein